MSEPLQGVLQLVPEFGISQVSDTLTEALRHFSDQLGAAGLGADPDLAALWLRAQGPSTVVEAGGRGGRKVKEKYGHAFFVDLGKQGGAALKEQHGDDNQFAELGKLGGRTLKEKRGSAFFSAIGKLGGSAPKRARRRSSTPPDDA